jgi:PilZ domain
MPVPPPLPPMRSPRPASGSGAGDRAQLVRSLRLLTPSVARAACGKVPSNRRGEIRRALRLGCRVRRVADLRLVGDRALDLSPQGVLLLSDERIDPGVELVVSFITTDFPIWFDTRATVARVVEGRRPGDPGRALGLRFESLPAVSRLILRGHLRKIPPTLPQRELPPDLTPRRSPDYARMIRDICAEA